MTRWIKVSLGLIVLAILGLLWTRWVGNWFYHPLGACTPNPNCKGYQIWSGLISDFSEITLVIGLISFSAGWYHHHQCQGVEPGGKTCRRIGIHPIENTPHKTCWVHHPVLGRYPHHHIPLAHIHQAHQDANPHLYDDDQLLPAPITTPEPSQIEHVSASGIIR